MTVELLKKYPDTSFQISKLNNDFGPAVLEKGIPWADTASLQRANRWFGPCSHPDERRPWERSLMLSSRQS